MRLNSKECYLWFLWKKNLKKREKKKAVEIKKKNFNNEKCN